MRGEQDSQIELLTTTSPGKRVPATHPIREVKRLADEALRRFDHLFDEMYSNIGRPSIPPERLLKAQLLERPARTVPVDEDRCTNPMAGQPR